MWSMIKGFLGGNWVVLALVAALGTSATAAAIYRGNAKAEATARAAETRRADQAEAAIVTLREDAGRQMAEIAKLIEGDGQRTRDLAAIQEAARRDPSYSAAAAAVIDATLARLRAGKQPAADKPPVLGDPGPAARLPAAPAP